MQQGAGERDSATLLIRGHDRDDQIAYCVTHMLPIWERWTDGNLAARRLLACESAVPRSYDERFHLFMQTTRALRGQERDASIAAALTAAAACLHAYLGMPPERFAWACRRAVAADHAARDRRG